jgi:superkiller protein 3
VSFIQYNWNISSTQLSPRVRKAFNVILATSLVHLFPPKHHARALPIVDDVLSQDPDNIAGLMARGYILQAACQWTEASEFFSHVIKLIPDDLQEGLRAREELAWCQIQSHDYENGMDGLKRVLELQDRSSDQARCLWRLGKTHWEMGGKPICHVRDRKFMSNSRRTTRRSLSSFHFNT